MPKSRAEDWSHHTHPDRESRHHDDRHGNASKDYKSSRVRERSPNRRSEALTTEERRSASPDGESYRTHRPHSHHHRREHNRSRHTSEATAGPVTLPFSARTLSKSDYRTFEPLFAYYLDLQKQRYIEDMDEREIKGRWKSFVGKWNRNELAEGWYDPEMFAKCAAESSRPDEPRDEPKEEPEREISTKRDAAPLAGDSDGDDYGPTLPSSDPRRQIGAKAATFQDLSLRNELVEEQRHADREELRLARKADRAVQKERLEELAPRAEAGTRERRLEKKKEVNDKMKQFRDKSPGMEAGDEKEIMGGGDELEEYKRMKEKEQKRKSERQVRREEFERARREEMEERRRAWQEREEGTVSMLRELAKQRFG
ncbi:RNA helicase [Pochonia chlamydosporia 170]|uniref:RNA helicase n=1 Tax=Pochonia chlamydosporia 170 TaxID=1380566 RepID=A0A179G9I9_METCM|nr:RNA helicase [Pochonia chlamydosporia 170]OAQ73819.1 RNA helicase [Pochonia chlamydosporia 170]